MSDTTQRAPSPAVAERAPSPAERLVGELASYLAQVMAQAAPLGLCWECGMDIRMSPVEHKAHCEWGRVLARAAAFVDHAPQLAVTAREAITTLRNAGMAGEGWLNRADSVLDTYDADCAKETK